MKLERRGNVDLNQVLLKYFTILIVGYNYGCILQPVLAIAADMVTATQAEHSLKNR